jgi:hypothetical protein
MENVEKEPGHSPDESQTFERGKMDLVKFGEVTIGRVTLQPGWSWEKSIKPIQKNRDLSITTHIQYIISWRIGVSLEGGTKEELGPGDVAMIPPGHKTWVIGNEPVVGIDFNYLEENTKQPLSR